MGGEGRQTLGPRLAEGKTKDHLRALDRPALAVMVHKDDITAGDGARRNTLPGKSALSGRTTANVFRAAPGRGYSDALRGRSGRRSDGRSPLHDDPARSGDAPHRHWVLPQAQRCGRKGRGSTRRWSSFSSKTMPSMIPSSTLHGSSRTASRPRKRSNGWRKLAGKSSSSGSSLGQAGRATGRPQDRVWSRHRRQSAGGGRHRQ